MRTLLLFRGAPGCGKSTFIKEHDLESFTLSPDRIRMMYGSTELTVEGKEIVTLSKDRDVWGTVFSILENRMKNGEFTVIDATNSKTQEINRYKDLAKTYRYRMFIIDMTGLPIDECKRRNKLRPGYKQVPESVIDNMYARFATQIIPSGIKVVSPDEAMNSIMMKPLDLNAWKKIHIIGDVHGCHTCLQTYLDGGIKEDEYYIFTGDYLDRGIENVEMFKFLQVLTEKPNVLLLEGNHERWLDSYAKGTAARSREFENYTRHELEAAGVTAREARVVRHKFAQCAWFDYEGRNFFVCHGGISSLKRNPIFVATEQMIKGVGKYEDISTVAESWEQNTADNCYQVFGHRNIEGLPIDMGNRCFNLEGKVEHGGSLRCLELTHEDPYIKFIETKNNVFRPEKIKEEQERTVPQNSISDLVNAMRNSKSIVEREFNNISSFNFTRDAFKKKKWGEIVNKARGLFIDTEHSKIVARSYDKFFSVNEMPETNLETLRNNLKFPLFAYKKENGFLGLISYDSTNDGLFVSSKSNPIGSMSDLFREILNNVTSQEQRDKLKWFAKENDCTFVFEVIDPAKDPHIIKYEKQHIVLLDCIKNEIELKKLPYKSLVEFGDLNGFAVKKLLYKIDDASSFGTWYDNVTKNDCLDDGKHIEGFVVEDSDGFMFKVKLPYYREWKFLRGIAQRVSKYGAITNPGCLTTALENYFYGYLRELKKNNPEYLESANIIELRDSFYKISKEVGDQYE